MKKETTEINAGGIARERANLCGTPCIIIVRWSKTLSGTELIIFWTFRYSWPVSTAPRVPVKLNIYNIISYAAARLSANDFRCDYLCDAWKLFVKNSGRRSTSRLSIGWYLYFTGLKYCKSLIVVLLYMIIVVTII